MTLRRYSKLSASSLLRLVRCDSLASEMEDDIEPFASVACNGGLDTCEGESPEYDAK